MMWQARITVVYGQSLLQEKIRHNHALDNTDIVVVFVVETTTSVQVSAEIGICPTEIGSYWSEIVLLYVEMDVVVQTPSVVISVAMSHTGVMPGDRCILYIDWCCFIGNGLLHQRGGYSSSLFCLPVSQTDEQDDKGQVWTHTSLLSGIPLKTMEGYSLDDEDAAIYSNPEDVNCFFIGGSGLTKP